MELLVVELVVVVVVPVAWETDSGSRDVVVAFDTDDTDYEHIGQEHHNVAHKVVHNVIDRSVVGVRSVVELFSNSKLFQGTTLDMMW